MMLVFFPFLAVVEFVVVQFTLKQEHSHPHAEDETFLWQSSIFFNVVLVYLSLEVLTPLFVWKGPRVHHLVYSALWGASLACLLPIELSVASGDLVLSRPAMSILYVGLFLLAVLRFVTFYHPTTWVSLGAAERAPKR